MRKQLGAIAALAGVLGLSSAILAAGARLEQPGFEVSDEDVASIQVNMPEPSGGEGDEALAAPEAGDEQGAAPDTEDLSLETPPQADAAAEDETAAEPAAEGQLQLAQEATPVQPDAGLERIAPRPPLSDLSTPAPPKPPKAAPPERWQPQRLFNPTATAAGIIEAKGHRVSLDGVDPLAADATCDWQGRNWNCGVQARTAFRSWLRSRAVVCKLPPVADREAIVAECRVGNEDPSKWLVENGWVKARADGDYAELGRKAEEGKKGQFGAPPSRVLPVLPSLTPPPAAPAPPPVIAAPVEPVTPESAAPSAPSAPGVIPPAAPPPGFPPAPTIEPAPVQPTPAQ